MGKTILFFVRHFTERGTEVAIYDYAHWNETILGNTSLIGYFSQATQKRYGLPEERHSFSKFSQRFTMLELNSMEDMTTLIDQYKIDFFYTLTHGAYEAFYQFENKSLWKTCKTIKHCVFETRSSQGDVYASISNDLNCYFHTNIPVIPHIVPYVEEGQNLRRDLTIPEDALVLGRYGGTNVFNLSFVHEAIREILNDPSLKHVYFLFMNTDKFYYHPRIIYLNMTTDLKEKAKMVNTCDAMIHARQDGETFGLSIAEFSIRNKPILTCPCGSLEHILILKEKALIYNDKEDLKNKIKNLREIIKSREDWNAYHEYAPEKVMKIFEKVALTPK